MDQKFSFDITGFNYYALSINIKDMGTGAINTNCIYSLSDQMSEIDSFGKLFAQAINSA